MEKLVATPVAQFLADIKGGVLEQQIGHALSDVAGCVKEVGGTGEVVLTLKVSRIPNTSMLNVAHKMKFVAPTSTGTRTEDTAGVTPMHVNSGGKLSLMPDNQMDFLKQESPAKA